MCAQTKPRLAIVIGSGGLKCAAAIGVMQVLEEENIPVDLVVGCSGGSIFGALIALGYSSERMIEAMKKRWTSDVDKKMDIRSVAKIAFPNVFGFDDRIGIVDDKLIIQNLARAFGPDTSFDDMQIPYRCVATDFNNGEAVVISEGNLVNAIRISSGIPVVFKPVEWNGRLMIDGGFSNPLPVDVAIQEGADVIIAIGFETPLVQSVSSPANFASQMFNILVNQLLYRKYAFYNLAYHSEIVAIIPHFEQGIKLNEVENVPFVIEQGRNETLKHIGQLKKVLAAHGR